MKQRFRGFMYGVGVTLALAVTAAYAFDRDLGVADYQLTHDFIHEVNKLVNNHCQVHVGNGRVTATRRCYRGQVMTGIDRDYIYCSDVSVSCFTKLKPQDTPTD